MRAAIDADPEPTPTPTPTPTSSHASPALSPDLAHAVAAYIIPRSTSTDAKISEKNNARKLANPCLGKQHVKGSAPSTEGPVQAIPTPNPALPAAWCVVVDGQAAPLRLFDFSNIITPVDSPTPDSHGHFRGQADAQTHLPDPGCIHVFLGFPSISATIRNSAASGSLSGAGSASALSLPARSVHRITELASPENAPSRSRDSPTSLSLVDALKQWYPGLHVGAAALPAGVDASSLSRVVVGLQGHNNCGFLVPSFPKHPIKPSFLTLIRCPLCVPCLNHKQQRKGK
jgi:hypothetical protein